MTKNTTADHIVITVGHTQSCITHGICNATMSALEIQCFFQQ